MDLYQRVIRVIFALTFVGGGIAHLYFGRATPDGYRAFADTALIPWLASLWRSFVVPNIAWLTILLGAYEIACGLGIIWSRTVVIAAWGMIAFLVFITIVGYGFATNSAVEDVLKNRLCTIVMIVLLIPLLNPANTQ